MTLVGRAKLNHPALGATGGAPLHASIESIYTDIANHLGARYKSYSALANSTLSTYEHNFGVSFDDLRVYIYTGTHPTLTLVTDPVASGWTIVATGGSSKTQIDVTTPSSGGPHTFVVLVEQNKRERYLDVHEVASQATPPSGTVRIYSKSDKKVYKKGSDGLEQQIGSGGGAGGVNYLVSSNKAWDFEDNATTGWATYADAAATSPVDGTGGSPSVTFASSASSPLRGVYHGLFTKDAANRQGEGVAVAFTLDNQEKGKLFTFRFDCETSVNYTGSSGSEYARVFVYDVTNAQLLPGYFEIAKGSGECKGYFVATTSTSYRFIMHVAGTGTSAWTMKVDNVQVSPQTFLMGTSQTDWISANTASITTQGFGTPTWSFFKYRIDGDELEVQFEFTSGTSTGVEARVGLPSGFVTNSGSSIQPCGVFHNNNASSVRYLSVEDAKTYMVISSDTAFATKEIGTGVASVGWVLAGWARFPIANYSSNVVQANRAVEEYVYNSDTSDADELTSFAYGMGGQFGNFTAERTKRVRFQQAIQPTDLLLVKITDDTGSTFLPIGQASLVHTYSVQNTESYGIRLDVVNSTDVDVIFGKYRQATGATFGSSGTNWSAIDADPQYRWAVCKIAGGAAVGYPVGEVNVIKLKETISSTGTLNDLSFVNYESQVIRFTGAAPTVTGLASNKVDGRVLTLIAPSGTTLVLNDQDAGSVASNRIITGSGAALTVTGDGSAQLIYDGESQRWRVINSTL